MEKKESTWDVLFKPPVRIFHRSCVKREGEEIHKMTFLGISIICFVALQWNTWMEGLFCRRGRMANATSLFQGLCWVEGLEQLLTALRTEGKGFIWYLGGTWAAWMMNFFSYSPAFLYMLIKLQVLGIPNLTFLTLQIFTAWSYVDLQCLPWNTNGLKLPYINKTLFSTSKWEFNSKVLACPVNETHLVPWHEFITFFSARTFN